MAEKKYHYLCSVKLTSIPKKAIKSLKKLLVTEGYNYRVRYSVKLRGWHFYVHRETTELERTEMRSFLREFIEEIQKMKADSALKGKQILDNPIYVEHTLKND